MERTPSDLRTMPTRAYVPVAAKARMADRMSILGCIVQVWFWTCVKVTV